MIEKAGEVLDREKARELAEDDGMIYIETSTKNGELDKLEEAFTELTRKIIEKKKKDSTLKITEKEEKELPGKVSEKKKKESPRKVNKEKKKELTF